MSLVLKDIILRMSLELLRDVTDLQLSDTQDSKQLIKSLDTLAHALSNTIEVLNNEEV